MSNSPTDFAVYSGIKSFAAACIFAGLWLILLSVFIFRSIQRPTYVYIFTSFFCATRVASFVMRAYISKSYTAAHDPGLNVAYQILFNIGFLGIIYSAYVCVLDREENKPDTPTGLVARVLKSRNLIRIILIVAVVLGVMGATELFNAKNQGDVDSANTKRDWSIHIFLGVTILLAVLIALIGRTEFTAPRQDGSTRYFLLLVLLTAILLVREIFLSATTDNHAEQSKELLWYPLVALTEVLAVCILAIPGVVPEKRKEYATVEPMQDLEQSGYKNYASSQQV